MLGRECCVPVALRRHGSPDRYAVTRSTVTRETADAAACQMTHHVLLLRVTSPPNRGPLRRSYQDFGTTKWVRSVFGIKVHCDADSEQLGVSAQLELLLNTGNGNQHEIRPRRPGSAERRPSTVHRGLNGFVTSVTLTPCSRSPSVGSLRHRDARRGATRFASVPACVCGGSGPAVEARRDGVMTVGCNRAC